MGEAPFEFGVGAAQRHFRIGADMSREIDDCKQEVSGLGGQFVAMVSTARGSFQSNPTLPALRCNSRARVSAGWPTLTPDNNELEVDSWGGRRAARSAFSSALMRSQALLTPAGAMFPPSSAKT